jgi:AraC family transcriptional activator of pobA
VGASIQGSRNGSASLAGGAADGPPFIHYDDRLPGGDLRFLHVERISTRVRKYNWELFPHRHRDLFQMIVLQAGRGHFNFDLSEDTFEAPSIVLVPPLVVHSFRYDPGAAGQILTVSDSYIHELARFAGEPQLPEMLMHPMVHALHEAGRDLAHIETALKTIGDNLSSARRGRGAILSANLLAILGLLSRYAREEPAPGSETKRRSQLYADFRELLERHYREQLPIASYAGMMAVTERTLHRTCREVAGESPLKIAHRRMVLEAQRLLLYSSLTVSEIAYYLGFKDPSNFSRFFVDNTGEPPQVFRRARLG